MGLLSFLRPGRTSTAAAAVMLSAAAPTSVSAAAVDAKAPTLSSPRTRVKSKAGTQITAGKITSRDFNSEVRGPNWYGRPGTTGIAQQMMTDTMVSQSVEYVTSVVTDGNWYFKPASESALDKEIADFATMALLERGTWPVTVRAWMRGYITNGFHLSEPVEGYTRVSPDRFPNHLGEGTGIVPVEFVDVPAWTIDRFEQSKRRTRKLHSIVQYILGSDGEVAGYNTVKAPRLIRMTWDQDGADFAGNPILRRVYGAWKIKQLLLQLDTIKHERMGVGTPSFTYAEGAGDAALDAATLVLEELRSNDKGFFLLPPEWTFDWNTVSKGDGSDIAAAISRCDIYIAQNPGAGYMMLGLQSQAGSYALGATQQGQHHLQALAHVRFIQAAVNFGYDGWSIVQRIVRLNYGAEAAAPLLACRNLPTKPVFETVKTYISGVQSGAITRDDRIENESRSMLDYSPIDHETASAVIGSPSSQVAAIEEGATVDENGQPTEPADEPATEPAEPEAEAKTGVRAEEDRAKTYPTRSIVTDVASKVMERASGIEILTTTQPYTREEAERVLAGAGSTSFSEAPSAATPAEGEG